MSSLSLSTCSPRVLVPLQVSDQPGALPLHLGRGSVPVHRLHCDLQGQSGPGGEHGLQLCPHKAEQGVPEEGAVRGRTDVPPGARERGRRGGLHLRETQDPVLLEGTHSAVCLF